MALGEDTLETTVVAEVVLEVVAITGEEEGEEVGDSRIVMKTSQEVETRVTTQFP